MPLRVARIWRPLLLLAGLGVVAWLVWRVGPDTVWDSLRALGWWLLLILLFPYVMVLALDTLGWRVLFRGTRVPLAALVRARLAGEAVNLTTPTASVGGEPLKAYLLTPWVPPGQAWASVIVDKTTVVAGQGLFLIAGLGVAYRLLPGAMPLVWGMALLLGVEVLAVGGFIVVQVLGVFGGAGRLFSRFGLGPPAHYQVGLEDLDRQLAAYYREARGRLLASALLHGCAWAMAAAEIYLVLALSDIHARPATIFVIESFAAAVKFASFMIPGSLGALDGGYVGFFAAFGLGGAVGLAYTVVRRLRELLWVLAGFLALALGPGRTAAGDA